MATGRECRQHDTCLRVLGSVCVCVCDLETLTVRRPKPDLGCSATVKKDSKNPFKALIS
jgi:hypothetical protein